MRLNLIVFSIPAFLLLIGLEMWVARSRKLKIYRPLDSISNISTGMADQLLAALTYGWLFFAPYEWIRGHWGLWEWDTKSPLTWALAFVATDFAYYLWHRASHRVNFMWAVHQVHHQGREYNLSLALRQNWLAGPTSVLFYLPLALLGFPVMVFAAVKSVGLLYQFWIHTRLIGRLGPFEWVFNTPSQHRVHHGINPHYLDSNYAGVLCIWDRLLGTFSEEQEAPSYGVLRPLRSRNALWSWVWPWTVITAKASLFTRFLDRVRCWVSAPGWSPSDAGAFGLQTLFDEAKNDHFEEMLPQNVVRGILLQFVVTLAGSAALLFWGPSLPLGWRLTSTAILFISIYSYGVRSDRQGATEASVTHS